MVNCAFKEIGIACHWGHLLRRFSFPISLGIGPENEFWPSPKNRSLLRLPSSVGSSPFILFLVSSSRSEIGKNGQKWLGEKKLLESTRQRELSYISYLDLSTSQTRLVQSQKSDFRTSECKVSDWTTRQSPKEESQPSSATSNPASRKAHHCCRLHCQNYRLRECKTNEYIHPYI